MLANRHIERIKHKEKLALYGEITTINATSRHKWLFMKISNQITDEVVLRELGARLARVRLERNLTQAGLAEQAGVSKRTVERMEAGGATQLVNLVRVCRVLDLLERFEALIPEPVASPVAQLKLRGKERKRASSARATTARAGKWQWDDKP